MVHRPTRRQLKKVWLDAWEKLPHRRLQEWVERIPFHIQEIIRLEGGNEYKEGKPGGRVRQKRRKGHLTARLYLEDNEEDSGCE